MITFSFSGASHGEGYRGTICGIPKGTLVDIAYLNEQLKQRKQGVGRSSRQIFEDKAVFVGHENEQSFVADGGTLEFFVANTSVENRPDITAIRTGHADLVGVARHPNMTARQIAEIASARSSLCYVILGSICQQILQKWGISTHYVVEQIGCVSSQNCDDLQNEPFPCCDKVAQRQMLQAIQTAKDKGDSLGGVVRVVAKGVPMGVGEIFPYDKRLDGQISAQMMGIPSAKGIFFGNQNVHQQSGVEAHDEVKLENGKVVYSTNNCGGIVGGVTTGQDIVFCLYVKPIPTVKGVKTIDTKTLQQVDQHFERADCCVVPNVGLIATHLLNYVLANQMLTQLQQNPNQFDKNQAELFGFYKTQT